MNGRPRSARRGVAGSHACPMVHPIISPAPSSSHMTASVARQASGSLTLVPGGRMLTLTDVGIGFDSPGSGILRLYDADLVPIGSIDASTPVGGVPNSPTATRMGLAAAGSDGRMLYVRSGSSERGPLFPSQPARLLFVDLIEKHVTRSMSLGGYGLGWVSNAAPAKGP